MCVCVAANERRGYTRASVFPFYIGKKTTTSSRRTPRRCHTTFHTLGYTYDQPLSDQPLLHRVEAKERRTKLKAPRIYLCCTACSWQGCTNIYIVFYNN